jgi:hypothetical protein
LTDNLCPGQMNGIKASQWSVHCQERGRI